ncbi:S8 family serine peptidase [Neobacillus vireti]|uniref:Minor extracellular protease VpR n=1 Tax=Neobacillus vireti LMG 21834 TaxID=1131730 RepID=A0AB94ISV0_9BACI|nr:S8 family serine peptidase [Neobacillus vireti]ETI70134.1 minor extracellular protease VpR [Neobacillus vireti LMG 21834]KLT16487.1 hypothetical protein AA980_18655 [Neobacillus vireti]
MVGSAETEEMQAANEQLSRETLSQMRAIISEQKTALNKGPVLHSDLQNLSGDEEVAVIVELSEMPVALKKGINKISGKKFTKTDEQNVQEKVKAQQKKFENQLNSKGIKGKIHFAYNYTFNGVSLKLKASQVKNLLKMDGVKLVEPDVEMKALGNPVANDAISPDPNTAGQFLNVPNVWDLGYQGQNVKVAVLDTGIDYYHPEFQGIYKGGYNFIDQSSRTNYTRDRASDDPYETTPLDRPANKAEFDSNGSSFYTEHGTHVAGIIAAQGNIQPITFRL